MWVKGSTIRICHLSEIIPFKIILNFFLHSLHENIKNNYSRLETIRCEGVIFLKTLRSVLHSFFPSHHFLNHLFFSWILICGIGVTGAEYKSYEITKLHLFRVDISLQFSHSLNFARNGKVLHEKPLTLHRLLFIPRDKQGRLAVTSADVERGSLL